MVCSTKHIATIHTTRWRKRTSGGGSARGSFLEASLLQELDYNRELETTEQKLVEVAAGISMDNEAYLVQMLEELDGDGQVR